MRKAFSEAHNPLKSGFDVPTRLLISGNRWTTGPRPALPLSALAWYLIGLCPLAFVS